MRNQVVAQYLDALQADNREVPEMPWDRSARLAGKVLPPYTLAEASVHTRRTPLPLRRVPPQLCQLSSPDGRSTARLRRSGPPSALDPSGINGHTSTV